ncbi:MAG: hypothetical protein MN733_03485 [Nitrososphaera sp.]|nr:hypothetical protein [Nitrososphaera sp.]
MSTLTQITQRVIQSIGEVEGTSVQTYSEPRVEEAIIQTFELVFRKYWWPQYCKWFQRTLDGTLGIVTASLSEIKDFRDIRVVIPDGEEKGIPQLPWGKNPFNLTGTKPRYYEALDSSNANFTRRLQFWPKTATGDVFIYARLLPTIIAETELYLDDKLLINGAAWIILEDEDINPNAAQLRKDLFEENFAAIMKELGQQPIENPNRDSSQRYLSEWWPYP